MKIHRAANW